MPIIKDYTNKKFACLTLVTKVRSGGSGVGVIWLAHCDCGNQVDVRAKEVAAGRIRSCGKCQLGRDLRNTSRMRTDRTTKGERAWYMRYVRIAFKKKKKFELTPAQFLDITKQDCFLCGKSAARSETGLSEVGLLLDTENYALDNCIPICRECRKYKGTTNILEFLEYNYRVTSSVLRRGNVLSLQDFSEDQLISISVQERLLLHHFKTILQRD